VTNSRGFALRARLPLYPEFIVDQTKLRDFVYPDLKEFIEPLIDEKGLVKEEYIQ
jgi:FO synthase